MDALRTLVDSIVAASPFPVIETDGTQHDGLFLRQPTICRDCRSRTCAKASKTLRPAPESIATGTCPKGVGIALVLIGGMEVVLNGLFLQPHPGNLPRGVKKQLDTQRTTVADIERWRQGAGRLLRETADHMKKELDNSLGMFHDVQTTVSSILRNAEAFVSRLAGDDYDEKLSRLEPHEVALIKSAELLQRRLQLMPLLSNPAAAAYGSRRPTPVYAVLDMLVRTLRAVSISGQVDLRLRGSSFKKPRLYQSFETVPLVLLENAIKYSMPGQRVEVEVNDTDRGVHVSIASYSPYIAPEDRERIFERGFRGESAPRVAANGSGLGLYLASIVASANGFRLRLDSDDQNLLTNGVRYCTNTFSFTVT